MNALATSAPQHLADAIGWPSAYEVAGGACAFALGVSLTQPEVGPSQRPSHASTPAPAGTLRWRAGYATFAAGAGFGMLVTFTQPYALSLGASHVGALFVAYTLTALA
jgi:hypothetical protein